jgi:hypothetical protein
MTAVPLIRTWLMIFAKFTYLMGMCNRNRLISPHPLVVIQREVDVGIGRSWLRAISHPILSSMERKAGVPPWFADAAESSGRVVFVQRANPKPFVYFNQELVEGAGVALQRHTHFVTGRDRPNEP